MVKCKHCNNFCLGMQHKNNDLCCFCSVIHRNAYCDGCKSKLSILDDLKRDAEDSMKEILSSGIHYWYKLKYEFNILKYITNQRSDFNKHDKESFASMCHDGEFFLGLRTSGTDFVDLDFVLVKITDVKSHGVIPLMKTMKLYIERSDIFFWGNNGRIETISKFSIKDNVIIFSDSRENTGEIYETISM